MYYLSSICEMKPYSFNGVYQPSLLDPFPHSKVLLSYFYDRLSSFVQLSKLLTVSTFSEAAHNVCLGQRLGTDEGALEPPRVVSRPHVHARATSSTARIRIPGQKKWKGRNLVGVWMRPLPWLAGGLHVKLSEMFSRWIRMDITGYLEFWTIPLG